MATLTDIFDSPSYRKLKRLRESGYDGPVDQDGNKVESGPAVDILNDLRHRTPDPKNTK